MSSAIGEMSGGSIDVGRGGFQFPESWNCDVRMGALFAPFRSKTVNPNDWTSKMNFWTSLIETWCRGHGRVTVTSSRLKSDFTRKSVVPACLDEVVEHMRSSGVLVSKDSFTAGDDSWKTWTVKVLVTNPMKWTLNAVKTTLFGKPEPKEVEYVHLPAVKYLGESLLKAIPSSSQGKLMTLEDLMKFWTLGTSEDLMLVLVWLRRQKLAATRADGETGTLVKLSRGGVKPVVITDTDTGIYNLEKQSKALEANIEKLESAANSALEDAKKHVRSKSKSMAKVALRRKKEIEKTIEQRATALENVQALLHRIDQVKLDSDVVECYRSGVDALRRVFRETGLTEEMVTGTMDDLETELNRGRDVDEALARPMDPSLDANLEEELSRLLLDGAPSVPRDDPESATETSPAEPVQVQAPSPKRAKEKSAELNAKMEALSL